MTDSIVPDESTLYGDYDDNSDDDDWSDDDVQDNRDDSYDLSAEISLLLMILKAATVVKVMLLLRG